MVFSVFKKSKTMTEQIDIVKAYNIWNLLNARYESTESAQMYINFIHDRDFDIVLSNLINSFIKQEKQLESEAKRFKIKVPLRPPIDKKTSAEVSMINDKFIYNRTHSDMLSELFSLNRSVRSTLSHDGLRNMFKQFLFSHLQLYEKLNKYGKLKGWEDVPISFKTAKPQSNEPLSLGSAYHIWDHLRQRYYQLELTMFFSGIAHDMDFKAGLSIAAKTLENQIKKLEQLALKYEIPATPRNPASMAVGIDPETIEDRFMYQQLFLGIDAMVDMHLRAIIEMTKNDSLKKLFINFFQQELDAQDAIIKFGKMKGWLVTPPVYNDGFGG